MKTLNVPRELVLYFANEREIQRFFDNIKKNFEELQAQVEGATGSFTTTDGKTVTVTNGIIKTITGP